MKTQLLSSALFVALVASAAAEDACPGPIVASARAPNGLNFDPPKQYDTEKLARRRAITSWRREVAKRCPHSSTLWWRAHGKKIDCEGYAGGVECEARAHPAS